MCLLKGQRVCYPKNPVHHLHKQLQSFDNIWLVGQIWVTSTLDTSLWITVWWIELQNRFLRVQFYICKIESFSKRIQFYIVFSCEYCMDSERNGCLVEFSAVTQFRDVSFDEFRCLLCCGYPCFLLWRNLNGFNEKNISFVIYFTTLFTPMILFANRMEILIHFHKCLKKGPSPWCHTLSLLHVNYDVLRRLLNIPVQ